MENGEDDVILLLQITWNFQLFALFTKGWFTIESHLQKWRTDMHQNLSGLPLDSDFTAEVTITFLSFQNHVSNVTTSDVALQNSCPL